MILEHIDDLKLEIHKALAAAGETVCRIGYTKSTGRSWFYPHDLGFRVYTHVDPRFVPINDCRDNRKFVAVGCYNHNRKTLTRWLQILEAAGIHGVIDGDHFTKTRLHIWMPRPYDEYGNLIPGA